MRKQFFILCLSIGLFPCVLKAQVIDEPEGESKFTPQLTDTLDTLTDLYPDLLDDLKNNIVDQQLKVIPPSPQSALFEQYINHEVAGYNGLPEISIPLYEMDYKTITIPIHVSYHASGIKYKQFDGEMGAGWSLPAGGYRITRTIYGKPDELYPFYSAAEFQTKKNVSVSTPLNYMNRDAYLGKILHNESTGGKFDFISSTNDLYQDGEYDQFTYNIPLDNGHFIISNRKTKDIAFANTTQLKIEVDPGSSALKLESFRITDNKGNIYHFGGKVGGQDLVETQYFTGSGQVKTAWLLRMIETPYGDTINFDYVFYDLADGRYMPANYSLSDAPTFIEKSIKGTYSSQQAEKDWNVYSYYSTGYISQISTKKETITFSREVPTDRHVSPYLKQISVSNLSNVIIKRFFFTYVISPSDGKLSNSSVPCHNLLTKIAFGTESTSAPEKSYQFDYYDGPKVSNTNNHFYVYPDQWGYYKTSSLAIPQDAVIHKEFGNLDYLYYSSLGSASKSAKVSSAFSGTSVFHDRSTNETAPNYFSLKEIIFPTGGKTQYEYESNRYRWGTQEISGGGLRVKKITSTANNSSTPIISEFIYGQNEDGIGQIGLNNSSYNNFSWGFADEIYSFFMHTEIFPKYISRATIQRFFSHRSLIQEFENAIQIRYPKYIVRQYDSADKSYNGKTICNYQLSQELDFDEFREIDGLKVSLDNPSHLYGRFFIGHYYRGNKPILTEKTIYNAMNQLLYKESYTYKTVSTSSYTGLKIKQFYFFPDYSSSTFLAGFDENNCPYKWVSSLYAYSHPTISISKTLPLTKTQVQYDQNGANPIITTITYAYDTQNRVISTTQYNSATGSQVEEYSYPASGTTLYNKNMMSTVIQQVKKNNNTEIERIKYNYPSTSINLQTIQSSYRSGAAPRTDVTFNSYGPKGNIRQYTRKDGVVVSYIWGYNNQYPIAEVINASLAEICATLGKTDAYLLEIGTRVPTAQDWTLINSVYSQNNLSKAEVRVYKYNPLVGMTQYTDPNGFSTYYTYDIYGRLTEVYYMEGSTKRIIESYTYNYINK